MVEMIGLFFLIGVASEYAYARWTVTIVQHRLSSLFWAGIWAGLNVFFILHLANSQDIYNGLAWVLGIVVGTGVELLGKKAQPPQVLVPYDLWKQFHVDVETTPALEVLEWGKNHSVIKKDGKHIMFKGSRKAGRKKKHG